MRAKTFKKILTPFLIISLFFQTALIFSPKNAYAQAGASAGGNVTAGFDAGGIAGSALVCSGVADKMASLLNGLIGQLIPTTVPINDPANDMRENCLRMITKTIINMILDKITLSTVNWINNGFEGQPLWLENPGQFFGDIARSEINSVTGWFTCNGSQSCESYPFGRLVMESVLTNLQRQSQQNLQFSLNQVLAHGTYEEFRYDFSVGGWAGYSAFLEPQNNPFGNQLLISNEIGRRIGGTQVTTAGNFNAQLTQSGGFLSPRVCAMTATGDPQDVYIDENDPMHVPVGGPIPQVVYSSVGLSSPYDVPDANQQSVLDDFTARSKCVQWKTTTPGQVVGTRLTQGLDISTDSLIAADDFAENIGLIFDALINQLISATAGGLRGLSSDNPNSVLLAQVNGQQPGAVANGQAPPSGGDTILGNGPTNIADLPLLEVQNQYITEAQAARLLLDELMKKIRALDYCVPGPNPRWVQSATTNFQAAIASISPSNGLLTDINEQYYRNIINSLIGVTITESPAMYNHTQFTNFMQEVFNRYMARMLQSYSPNLAPPTARLFLPALFNDLEIYNAEMAELNDYLANIPSLLPTVEIIQTTLEDLAEANGGVLDSNDPAVQAQVSIFNSISDHLATQTQLNTLIARQDVYQTQIAVINGHYNSCFNETIANGAYSPNGRMSYPSPIFPYAGLPGSNLTFLPGVVFGNDSDDINIEINGVIVEIESNDLTDFEDILQSVY